MVMHSSITDDEQQRSVLEVNWSEFRAPKKSAFGILQHLTFLLTSMVDVASASARWMAPVYRASLFTITPGAVIFVLAASVSFVIVDDNLKQASG